jgi:two-component system, NarL family, nitrate/nitrite response regulator NarL
MSMPICVVIIGDVRLYREGLAESLRHQQGINIVGTAADWREACTLFRRHIDVVVLDIATHGSLEIANRIALELPHARVIGFGVQDDDRDVVTCAEAGLAGFVPCDASITDLVAAICGIVHDEMPCSARAAAVLFRRVGTLATVAREQARGIPLTGRELEIMSLVDRGLSNKEIARGLNVEVSTVKNHVHNILEKLQVTSRGEAAARIRSMRDSADADLKPQARVVSVTPSSRARSPRAARWPRHPRPAALADEDRGG